MDTNVAKVLAMIGLGLGSLTFGMLPFWLSQQQRRRHPLRLTILLCFGAGVLLATSMVHMLAEVKENLPNYAELLFCVGFFIIYIVDEVVHFCCGEAIQHSHAPPRQQVVHNHHNHDCHNETDSAEIASNNTTTRYGTGTTSETRSLLNKRPELPCNSNDIAVGITRSHSSIECSRTNETVNANICHTSHREPCEESLSGQFGLLCALSIHCILEGLAIGVQETGAKVILLAGAVSCHKFVVGFCLGIEFSSSTRTTLWNHFMAISIFSLGSVIGIGIGMGVTDLEKASNVIPVLQALAGGTLLYVTVCEVLPREKAKWHQRKRIAGIAQLVAVLIGFASMTLINTYLGD